MSKPRPAHQRGREVVIVEAARTPIGRGHSAKGVFRDVHPNELLGTAYRAVIERAGIEPELVEDVVAGCVSQVGEQSNNVARNAWLQAGLPVATPASTVDRQCGSGQQAVSFAAGLIAAGYPRRDDRRRASSTWAACRWDRTSPSRELGTPFPQGADGSLRADPAGPLGRADRRALGDPALRAGRARAALPPARRPGHRRGPLRSRDHPDSRSTARRSPPTRASADDTSLEQLAALKPAFKEGGTRHRRQLLADLRRRRCGAADGAREGRRAGPRRRARGSSTRRPSASTP